METRHLPLLPGIYCIRNLINGKRYIGSSVKLKYRLNNHRKELRGERHFSPVLSAAWAKYGEAAFVCELVEIVEDVTKLGEREQYWLDHYKCIAPNRYNISSCATSNTGLKHSDEWNENMGRAKRKVYPGYISPSGESITIDNMPKFCRDNSLIDVGMYDLAKGRIANHKGWSHENAKQSERFVGAVEGFIDPSGVEHPKVFDFLGFCKSRGLKRKTMLRMMRGELISHRGWSHKNAKARKPKEDWIRNEGDNHVGYYNPSGEAVTIKNRHQFCIDNGLDERTMCRLKSNPKRYRSHKGWRFGSPKAKPITRNRPIRGLIDPSGNPAIVNNAGKFRAEHGLSGTSVWKLLTGQIKQYKGWTYRKPAA